MGLCCFLAAPWRQSVDILLPNSICITIVMWLIVSSPCSALYNCTSPYTWSHLRNEILDWERERETRIIRCQNAMCCKLYALAGLAPSVITRNSRERIGLFIIQAPNMKIRQRSPRVMFAYLWWCLSFRTIHSYPKCTEKGEVVSRQLTSWHR